MELIAHRGNNRAYHENTLAAFHSSLRRGFRALELDLMRLGDGTVVVFHDFDLIRKFGMNVAVNSLTLEEFRKIFPELLTFDEFYRSYAGPTNIWVNFEIKDDALTFHAVREKLKRFQQAVVSSFKHHIVDEAILHGFEGAYLLHDLEEPSGKILGDRLHVPVTPDDDLERIEDLEDYDLYCYTVNDPGLVERLRAYSCVKGVFTDEIGPACLN